MPSTNYAPPRMTPNERAARYCEDVLSGVIIAGQKVILACERFRRELSKQEDPAYPWRYDVHLAERPVRFMEQFLIPVKGNYSAMVLMPWQCFVECNIYGWVSKKTGLRRFREALILVARGNGKSTLVSGNAIYGVSKDEENGAEVYLLANSKEQARIVFETCYAQIQASDALSSSFRALRDGVYYDRTNGLIRPRASDSRKLDGLNTHLGIFDEIHEMRDYKLINVIQRATNKRRQPLLIYISTMGTVLDGPLADFYVKFTDAMLEEPPMAQSVADTMFAYIAEIDQGDDISDESCWAKANPSLGELIQLDDLRLDYERCRGTPRMMADFITKQLNVMVDAQDETLVDAQVIARNQDVIDEEGLRGLPCYGGFDLSAREDFTAAALLFPLPDGRFYVKHHSWVPRRKVMLDNEKIDYLGWRDQGVLTIIDGEYVDQEQVFDWFVEMAHRYQLMGIGYDPANAVTLQRLLAAKGIQCEIIRQGPLTLNDPMKEMRVHLLDGKFVFNNDPMLRWYLSNVRLRNDYRDREKENWMPVKKNRYRKIDGFMAWLDAWALYLRQSPVRGVQREAQISVFDLFG